MISFLGLACALLQAMHGTLVPYCRCCRRRSQQQHDNVHQDAYSVSAMIPYLPHWLPTAALFFCTIKRSFRQICRTPHGDEHSPFCLSSPSFAPFCHDPYFDCGSSASCTSPSVAFVVAPSLTRKNLTLNLTAIAAVSPCFCLSSTLVLYPESVSVILHAFCLDHLCPAIVNATSPFSSLWNPYPCLLSVDETLHVSFPGHLPGHAYP